MQILHLTLESVEDYEANHSFDHIVAPQACPNCGNRRRLQAHGFYRRYTSCSGSGTPWIAIRRFRCVRCGKTASFLPSFAQPYRLIVNATIEAFFSGHLNREDVQRWAGRLRHYRRQFFAWLPFLRVKIRRLLRRLLRPTGEAVWTHIIGWAGGLDEATVFLTREFRVTLFGEYKCHLPNPP